MCRRGRRAAKVGMIRRTEGDIKVGSTVYCVKSIQQGGDLKKCAREEEL